MILPEKVLSAKRRRRLLFPTPGMKNNKQNERMRKNYATYDAADFR